jgi:S1/P1 Nuclease
MKNFWCAALLCLLPLQAFAWGQEGHSIIAEIAQREVKPETRTAIDRILHHGTLASVASWADDVKYTTRPDTAPWHFVDIPLKQHQYAPADCADKKDPTRGDICLVAALEKLKPALSCANDDNARRDALRFVVHLVGDATQPLHTVADLDGGNTLTVKLDFCGLKDSKCQQPERPQAVKFHVLWDSTLITETFYDWGGYVDRLYDPQSGWLNSAEARNPDPADDAVTDWVNDTHARAEDVWTKLLPATDVIDQSYYSAALPILDRQLGLGGLRLARYLDAALAPDACQAR